MTTVPDAAREPPATCRVSVRDRDGGTTVIAATAGDSLMEAIRDADLPILASCGGFCSCATCHVHVDPAWLPRLEPPKRNELALLRESGSYRPDISRLACQIRVSGALDGLAVSLAPND